MRTQYGNRHAQSGTTLIEILITVILVSVGLLGLAGLQLATVQNTNSAAERFEATTLARDILERMRANRQQALNGQYDLAMGDDPDVDGLAGDDLNAWMDSLAALPNGDGSVDVDDGVVTIEVEWTDASDDNADDSRDMSVFLRTGL
ncbi:MAG: type IV pilus modification protein PilV [Gammaproteobacteria bacterium]|nr:type IV pilus modification protein PilV [Gammaproteobacteria bacterium]